MIVLKCWQDMVTSIDVSDGSLICSLFFERYNNKNKNPPYFLDFQFFCLCDPMPGHFS